MSDWTNDTGKTVTIPIVTDVLDPNSERALQAKADFYRACRWSTWVRQADGTFALVSDFGSQDKPAC